MSADDAAPGMDAGSGPLCRKCGQEPRSGKNRWGVACIAASRKKSKPGRPAATGTPIKTKAQAAAAIKAVATAKVAPRDATSDAPEFKAVARPHGPNCQGVCCRAARAR